MNWYFQKISIKKKGQCFIRKLIIKINEMNGFSFSSFHFFFFYRISRQFNLKSKSKNTPDGERYLIVSKKISFIDLANNLLNNGIYSDLYDLIYPSDQRK